ncbi:ABC transporter permease [Faecalicoccus pleomorphus]|uniref:Transport permease protein n=1 Tax=Faecalicoccus pleomorphus TaxID=1323 RepID=A0A3E3E521_9FIRM|nr:MULTISPECIES: ABC transporter permease [Faecalicoccus]MBE6119048.1 ABC transporter permease [Erysipelotrichaceae bacterium]MDY5232862.1 ABC transporter permease [Faecalicoccus sp.]NME44207.1 ABC transporter permease [Faecalicoccus pleomorphus]RGD76572.1 ABC transporter permease [Faecalicoccus pleomorphus]
MQVFKNIYEYRELLKTNIKKDIRGKYKGSFLGVLWSFLNPLLQVVVYWIVFPYLMRGTPIPNYLCYLVIGIIPWTFLTSVVSQGTPCIKNNAGIIKKVYFPREILPISQVLSSLINFFISCIIIIIFCVGTGAGISYHIIFLPIIAIIQTIFNLGINFLLSALNVYVQDIEYIVTFVINMAFYGTPILYSLETLNNAPSFLVKLVQLNPMTTIIEAYRNIFMYHEFPLLKPLLLVFILSIIILIFGYLVFKKLEKGFAEEM